MRPIRATGVSLWREKRLVAQAILAVLLTALTGSLSGCADWYPSEKGYRQALDTWIGSTGEQLVAQWGAPAGEHTSPDGRKIYQYKNQRSYTVSGGTKSEQVKVDDNYVSVDIPQPDEIRTTWCDTTFHLNADDIIESYNFKGPDCTAYEK